MINTQSKLLEISNSLNELMGTVNDLVSTLNDFATATEERFDRIDKKFEKIDQRFEKLECRVDRVENRMVTKDYLDDKLSDLRADLVTLARKQNRKFETLVEELVSEGRLKPAAAKKILALEPFPH